MLKINNISAGYGKKAVLKDISFKINKADFLGIIGPTGSGKSTLLKSLSSALRLISGNILLNDKPLAEIKRSELALLMAYVPQEISISFNFTVSEIVLMGRTPFIKRLGYESKKDKEIAYQALKMVNAHNFWDRDITQLSSGERQRVIIAKALAQQPKILFLDEPTSHLDIGHSKDVFDLLLKLNKTQGLTVVSVLHDLNLASLYCDKVLMLNQGRLYRLGRPQEVFDYKVIEEVYKTLVVVEENPVNKKPYIYMVPCEIR